MNFADVAEKVLEKAAGGPLRYEEITKRAIASGLISPKSDQPWVYMASAINNDSRSRIARGDRPRFTSPRRGSVQLNAPSSAPEAAVKLWNEQSKKKLVKRLGETDPYRFEQLIGELLSLIGFEDIAVTKRSRDGGIDVRGTLTVGGITQVATAIQVKRWEKNVGADEVRKLRGSLEGQEQGLIVTLSDFTQDALDEAANDKRGEVTLINGRRLVELMAEHGLGFRRRELLVLEVLENTFVDAADDEQVQEDLVEEGPSDLPDQRPGGNLAAATLRPRSLSTLPGRPSNYLRSLSTLLDCVAKQPTFDEFLDSFQHLFPEITLRQEAKRRAGVLLSLGFARIDGDRIALTPDGNKFLTSRDPGLVGDAITTRIPGGADVAELLAVTKDRDRILAELKVRGNPITRTQVNNLCKWLQG